MKYSELWLRKWINTSLSQKALADRLTMTGFEIESITPASESWSGVVIGEIMNVRFHPEAANLSICEINIGNAQLTIVSGAPHLASKMKVAVATVGALLPRGSSITQATFHNVISDGMLCSANELSLSDDATLLVLPQDAPVGESLWHYLQLSDDVIEVGITPNRGDCLSVRGLAREIAASTQTHLTEMTIPFIPAQIKDHLPITVQTPAACPRYVSRIIRGIRSDAMTPVWLKECLRRSGIRAIHPVVDITNYVMLELGQPMHAFDLVKIDSQLNIRFAKQQEKIVLLDGNEVILRDDTLVIADQHHPLALAGLMGGITSSVTLSTEDILLESAYFPPAIVAKAREQYGIYSDSGYRFERGVDPTIQQEAIERASQLILEICGGKPGAVVEIMNQAHLPPQKQIELSVAKLTKIVGIVIPETEVEAIFNALHFSWQRIEKGWKVNVPVYRFDLSIPEDIVEEIARLYGYERIPAKPITAELAVSPVQQDESLLRVALREKGLHEIISYSFIDQALAELFDPDARYYVLTNPISAEMNVMRPSLWPGLMKTLMHNQSRQQYRIPLFEIGNCFTVKADQLIETSQLGILMSGHAYDEQWGYPKRDVDFYDLRGIVDNLLSTYFPKVSLEVERDQHPALHPGQCAAIYWVDGDERHRLGIMGAIHPRILQALDLTDPVFVAELEIDQLKKKTGFILKELSKFPEIRRDLAILLDRTIPAKVIRDTIQKVAGNWLKDIFIFDVYMGKGVPEHEKSIALALILQHPSRTLVDDEVNQLVERIIRTLEDELGAQLRR